jgi:hypothetical protein
VVAWSEAPGTPGSSRSDRGRAGSRPDENTEAAEVLNRADDVMDDLFLTLYRTLSPTTR